MAEYQLTETDVVIRTSDGANFIPGHRWHDEYLAWCEAGGVPDPYAEPKLGPQPLSTDEVVFFNHENRIRAIEGKEPVSIKEFFELRTKLRE